MTPVQLLASPSVRAGDDVEAITLSQEPLRLRSDRLDDVINLQLRQQFRIVKDDKAPRARLWRASTVAYFYQLDDSAGRELAAWHWHPGTGAAFPHIHVASGPIEKQVHLPTGRVSIESILRLLLDELEVPPVRAHAGDYGRILDKAEGDFIEHRSWHA